MFVVAVVSLSFAVFKNNAGPSPASTETGNTETSNKDGSEITETPVGASGDINLLDISGQGLEKVPGEIFKRTSLESLDISHNNLTGAIPAEIRFLKNLRVLDLSDNKMTGLPAELGQLSKLETLDVSNNSLTGLPLELGKLTQLKILNLSGNDYSEYDLKLIRQKLTGTNIITD